MAVALLEFENETIVYDADADTTEENDVRAGPCSLLSVDVSNPNTGVVILCLYDNAGPVIGTTEPDIVITCEGTTNGKRHAATGSDTFQSFIGVSGGATAGIPFTTGLSFAVTTDLGTPADPVSAVKVALRTAP